LSRPPALSTTSFAILSLLAVSPFSTYELARQMDRSLGRFWPRAQSKLYEEPKKLVAHGLAVGEAGRTGRRPRTVYAITPAGRAALAGWLAEPGAGPQLEFEGLVKVAFAENGSRADALDTLAAVRAWAVERNADNLAIARAYRTGEGDYPGRAAQSVLAGAFLTDYYAMVARWAEWATTQVEGWPEQPADARLDPAVLDEVARRADWA